MNIAIIFAGGSGVRMGAGLPKQFLEVGGKPIIIHTLQLFQYHAGIDKIYVGITDGYQSYMKSLVEEYRITKVCQILTGGETAQDTIYNLLKCASENEPADSIVLIHDGVRPFISYDVISQNIAAVKKFGSSITSTSANETIVISKDGESVDGVPHRKNAYAVQAPQSFRLADILAAHEKVRALPTGYEDLIDQCTIMRSLGIPVHLIEGNRGNIKVTNPVDFYMFRALLQYKENEQAFGLGITDRIHSRMPAENEK